MESLEGPGSRYCGRESVGQVGSLHSSLHTEVAGERGRWGELNSWQ